MSNVPILRFAQRRARFRRYLAPVALAVSTIGVAHGGHGFLAGCSAPQQSRDANGTDGPHARNLRSQSRVAIGRPFHGESCSRVELINERKATVCPQNLNLCARDEAFVGKCFVRDDLFVIFSRKHLHALANQRV